MSSQRVQMRLPWLLVLELVFIYSHASPYVATIATLEANGTNNRLGMIRFGPAINLALEAIRETYAGYIEFEFIHKDIDCSASRVGSQAAAIYHTMDVNVFIGPACAQSMEPLGYMTKEWNLPVITPVGYKGVLKNKTLFPTVTRLSSFGQEQFADFTMQILQYYNWNHIAIIFDDRDAESMASLMGTSFMDFFMDTDFEWSDFPMLAGDFTEQGYENVLREASENSRIFIIHAEMDKLRELMLAAHRLGFTRGDYAFIVTITLSTTITSDVWKRGDEMDEVALEAFQSTFFLSVTSSNKSEFHMFKDAIQRRVQNRHSIRIQIDDFANIAAYYDAFTIYAEALNNTLAAGGNPLDGRQISRDMWNRTYMGIAGPLTLNENGGRDANLVLLDFSATGEVVVVGTYTGKEKSYRELDGMDIIWPRNSGPPTDVPECGFRGYKCEYKHTDSSLIGGLAGGISGFIVIGAVVIGVCLSRWRFTSEVERWWWVVDENELKMGTNNDKLSAQSLSSKFGSITPRSDCRLDDSPEKATYKGCTVRVRKLIMKSINYDKNLLDEFEQIRGLIQPNLVRVVGACLQGVDKYILTEHCSKGTLQEMIGNGEVKMDRDLKFALCMDVAKGLCFIHESPLHHHGRLSSATCFVDNRFMVKLTDFAPHYVFSRLMVSESSDEYKEECVWRSPELLRTGDCTGTREGDIYSFGVLLQEVFTGDTPFAIETVTMGLDYVIEKIMQTDGEPFRPEFNVQEGIKPVKDLAVRCWSELPNHRPLMANVKRDLQDIAVTLGASGTLMDSLLRRMQQYANKLERLADEKTVELREEKKKTEELLDQILPRPVANQLKLGQRVKPDSFDSVTVCFTDICGFTDLSSRSTPMQVVDILNDLYSCFDDIIDNYDVYKVETIGDSYMVVSGLPVRNGDLHAAEIARMSLTLLQAIDNVRAPHMPDEKLKLRIGVHSGSVCAGVVGIKMPRYCLFGDTVNTASRMESHGEECKIHISSETKFVLDRCGTFIVHSRGVIDVKGKGKLETYWLMAEDEPIY